MKIYTKTGDKGKTSLGTGERVWKNAKRVEATGTLDELNALLGHIGSELQEGTKAHNKYLENILLSIQQNLFAIQSHIANPSQKEIIGNLDERTKHLEQEIDTMTEKLPELTNFILPGGGKVGSLFHMARTLARRAERRIVDVLQEEDVDTTVISYMNRLSDVFFTMARFISLKEKKKETLWSKSRHLLK